MLLRYIRTYIAMVLAGEALLALGGVVLSLSDNSWGTPFSFFSYQVGRVDRVHVWILVVGMVMVANGVWLGRLATAEFSLNSLPTGSGRSWVAELPLNPLKLLGRNLVFVPIVLACYLLVRHLTL